MAIDQPVISYKTDKKKGMMASRKEVAELDALADAWEKKRQGKRYVGEKFSLNDFMRSDLGKNISSTQA